MYFSEKKYALENTEIKNVIFFYQIKVWLGGSLFCLSGPRSLAMNELSRVVFVGLKHGNFLVNIFISGITLQTKQNN